MKMIIIINKGVEMPSPHRWQHKFQGHVSRWTVSLEAILDLLSRTVKHMSAKEIYTSLYQRHPSLGLTTVYRTLNLLARMSLINKITISDGQRRFELKKGKKKITITTSSVWGATKYSIIKNLKKKNLPL